MWSRPRGKKSLALTVHSGNAIFNIGMCRTYIDFGLSGRLHILNHFLIGPVASQTWKHCMYKEKLMK